jgi:hypothetical protein
MMRWRPWAVCVSAWLLTASAWTLDREAFTFTRYNLNVRIEPEQQRIGVRGTITLRNDSKVPQRNAVLQISSSLTWRSIRASGQMVQFVSQPYTSDIDHTGELSEAIVTLPQDVAPGGAVDLDIAYEGVIPLDATRLTRIGVPKETAVHSDWDQVSPSFTAVRGVGFVTWYPVAMEAASLSEGSSVFDTLGRWKQRQAESNMRVIFAATGVNSGDDVHFSGAPDLLTMQVEKGDTAKYREFRIARLGWNMPSFVIGHYESLPAEDASQIAYLPGSKDAAEAYAGILSKLDQVVRVGRNAAKLTVLQLPDSSASPFAAGGMLLVPFQTPVTLESELAVVYACARQEIPTHRVWIQEGVAGFAQAEYLLQTKGRQGALDFLSRRLPLLVDAEKGNGHADDGNGTEQAFSLVHTTSDVYLQSKAAYVFWMLRDMLDGLDGKLLSYQASSDDDPSYLQHLLESQTHRDLQWFFDDWVYHDRGLPDFEITAFYPRRTEGSTYVSTVTVDNLGGAGAEVPVTVKFDGGEVTQRLRVRAKAHAVTRVETPGRPTEAIVNDGSVPESDLSNNAFKVPAVTK